MVSPPPTMQGAEKNILMLLQTKLFQANPKLFSIAALFVGAVTLHPLASHLSKINRLTQHQNSEGQLTRITSNQKKYSYFAASSLGKLNFLGTKTPYVVRLPSSPRTGLSFSLARGSSGTALLPRLGSGHDLGSNGFKSPNLSGRPSIATQVTRFFLEPLEKRPPQSCMALISHSEFYLCKNELDLNPNLECSKGTISVQIINLLSDGNFDKKLNALNLEQYFLQRKPHKHTGANNASSFQYELVCGSKKIPFASRMFEKTFLGAKQSIKREGSQETFTRSHKTSFICYTVKWADNDWSIVCNGSTLIPYTRAKSTILLDFLNKQNADLKNAIEENPVVAKKVQTFLNQEQVASSKIESAVIAEEVTSSKTVKKKPVPKNLSKTKNLPKTTAIDPSLNLQKFGDVLAKKPESCPLEPKRLSANQSEKTGSISVNPTQAAHPTPEQVANKLDTNVADAPTNSTLTLFNGPSSFDNHKANVIDFHLHGQLQGNAWKGVLLMLENHKKVGAILAQKKVSQLMQNVGLNQTNVGLPGAVVLQGINERTYLQQAQAAVHFLSDNQLQSLVCHYKSDLLKDQLSSPCMVSKATLSADFRCAKASTSERADHAGPKTGLSNARIAQKIEYYTQFVEIFRDFLNTMQFTQNSLLNSCELPLEHATKLSFVFNTLKNTTAVDNTVERNASSISTLLENHEMPSDTSTFEDKTSIYLQIEEGLSKFMTSCNYFVIGYQKMQEASVISAHAHAVLSLQSSPGRVADVASTSERADPAGPNKLVVKTAAVVSVSKPIEDLISERCLYNSDSEQTQEYLVRLNKNMLKYCFTYSQLKDALVGWKQKCTHYIQLYSQPEGAPNNGVNSNKEIVGYFTQKRQEIVNYEKKLESYFFQTWSQLRDCPQLHSLDKAVSPLFDDLSKASVNYLTTMENPSLAKLARQKISTILEKMAGLPPVLELQRAAATVSPNGVKKEQKATPSDLAFLQELFNEFQEKPLTELPQGRFLEQAPTSVTHQTVTALLPSTETGTYQLDLTGPSTRLTNEPTRVRTMRIGSTEFGHFIPAGRRQKQNFSNTAVVLRYKHKPE